MMLGPPAQFPADGPLLPVECCTGAALVTPAPSLAKGFAYALPGASFQIGGERYLLGELVMNEAVVIAIVILILNIAILFALAYFFHRYKIVRKEESDVRADTKGLPNAMGPAEFGG